MITTIVKTKNSSKTLCDTLESIRGLGEIFVIDEHSNDETIDIAKEYRAKIIYTLKTDIDLAYNQVLNESQGEWIFILEDNEIAPKKLVEFLKKYCEKPKKNKPAINLSIKSFYLDKELICAQKQALRFFRKDCIEFKNGTFNLINEKTKIYSHNKNFKLQNEYILNYLEKNVVLRSFKTFDKIILDNKKPDLFKPIKTFLYFYFIKKGYLEGICGLILAYFMAQESFIVETMKLEKSIKDDN